ncbi:phage terminase small subunit P27 family [Hymenobacter sp. BT594]|uniref:Phage terminase small subunit P27 family n=2 Tax=Hymenobacter guriensis TaxID=2793065 RepID=A0ABS0KWW0_9BACT|nr:phage terminase small subunit P27 family [Hymenobacter guriensis]
MRLPKLDTIEMAPDDLPEIGQAEWYRVVKQLTPLGVLNGADLSLLKSYCHHVATMEAAAAQLKEGGYTTIMTNKGGGSYEIKSPWVTIYNEASDRAAKLGQQFGLTPSARTRISVPAKTEEEKDGWDEL